jgi:peptidoglycan/LPS O-acetylase OafA/YrhL
MASVILNENRSKDKLRFHQIDGLRGLAALFVVLFHFTNGSNPYYGEAFAFPAGRHGVSLFFAISGFVISLTLNSKNSLSDFIKARFIRLYPIFWVCLIFSFVITSLFGPSHKKVSAIDFLINFSMIPQFLGTKYVDGAAWTLQIELFFYAVIAAIFYFSKKNPIYILAYFSIASIIFGTIEICGINEIMNSMPILLKSMYWRLYGLFNIEYNYLFSIGISIFIIKNNSVKDRIYKLACIALAIANMTALTVNLEEFFVSLAVTILLLTSFSFSPLRRLLSNKIFAWLGSISYVLYLIHTNVGRIIIQQAISVTNNINLSIILGTITIVIIAAIFTEWIEAPLRKFVAARLN